MAYGLSTQLFSAFLLNFSTITPISSGCPSQKTCCQFLFFIVIFEILHFSNVQFS